jgi:hypothetical protein
MLKPDSLITCIKNFEDRLHENVNKKEMKVMDFKFNFPIRCKIIILKISCLTNVTF